MNQDNLKNIFSLSATQKRGFLMLGLILVVIIAAPAFYRAFFLRPEIIDLEKDRTEIEAFVSSVRYKEIARTQDKCDDKTYKPFNLEQPELSAASSKLQPFHFNPNNLPAEQWMNMGFSQKQVQSIKKFEQKGGRFYTKKDVKKLWAISPEEYEIIEPYILLPDSLSGSKPYSKPFQKEKQYQIVELNSADTTALKTLPGIGSAYAAKIYNYKMKLGGFHSKYQLFEITGMDSARFAGIEPYIDINPWLIKPVNINTAEFESLSKHPYISKNVAISIINYRNRHGHYNTVEEVMKSELIDAALFKKLAPYLTTN